MQEGNVIREKFRTTVKENAQKIASIFKIKLIPSQDNSCLF